MGIKHRFGIQDRCDVRFASLEVTREHLDATAGHRISDRADRRCPDPRAPVGQVVSGDACDAAPCFLFDASRRAASAATVGLSKMSSNDSATSKRSRRRENNCVTVSESDEAISLNDYLAQAYELAGEFCELVAKRARGAGFLKTLLLRRLGSTIVAGTNTANKMLQDWEHVTDEDDSEEEAITVRADFKTLSPEEQLALEKFVRVLEMNRARDPKYEVVVRLLREGHAAAWSPEVHSR